MLYSTTNCAVRRDGRDYEELDGSSTRKPRIIIYQPGVRQRFGPERLDRLRSQAYAYVTQDKSMSKIARCCKAMGVRWGDRGEGLGARHA